MDGARQFHKMVTEFGLNTRDLVRRRGDTSNVWMSPEVALQKAYDDARLVKSPSVDVKHADYVAQAYHICTNYIHYFSALMNRKTLYLCKIRVYLKSLHYIL